MKRGGPLKRKKPMARRSKKTRDLYEREGGRRDVVARILKERPLCEAGWVIGRHQKGLVRRPERRESDPVYKHCQGFSVDVHEIKRRSGGGSILDDANLLAVCRFCHDWAGAHPKAAIALGLSASRYPSTT